MNFTKKKITHVTTSGYGNLFSVFDQPSASAVTRAAIDSGFQFLPTSAIVRGYQGIHLDIAEQRLIKDQPLDEDFTNYLVGLDRTEKSDTFKMMTNAEAQQAIKDSGLEEQLEVEDVISNVRLNNLIYQKKREIRNNRIMNRAKGSRFAKGVALQIATGFIDPINIPLAAVAVLNHPFRLAKALSGAGKVRASAALGAYGGAVGTAIADIPVYFQTRQEQLDYDLTNWGVNIVAGGIFGGTIGGVAGFLGADFRLNNATYSRLLREEMEASGLTSRTNKIAEKIAPSEKLIDDKKKQVKIANLVLKNDSDDTRHNKTTLAQKALEEGEQFDPEILDFAKNMEDVMLTQDLLREANLFKNSENRINKRRQEIKDTFDNAMKKGEIWDETGEYAGNLGVFIKVKRPRIQNPDKAINFLRAQKKEALARNTAERKRIYNKKSKLQQKQIKAIIPLLNAIDKLNSVTKSTNYEVTVEDIIRRLFTKKTNKPKDLWGAHVLRYQDRAKKLGLLNKQFDEKVGKKVFKGEYDQALEVRLQIEQVNQTKRIQAQNKVEGLLDSLAKEGLDKDELLAMFNNNDSYWATKPMSEKREKMYAKLVNAYQEGKRAEADRARKLIQREADKADAIRKNLEEPMDVWDKEGVAGLEKYVEDNLKDVTAEEIMEEYLRSLNRINTVKTKVLSKEPLKNALRKAFNCARRK